MDIMELSLTPTRKEYFVSENGHQVRVLEYYHVVNETWAINKVRRNFRSMLMANKYRSAIERTREVNSIVIKIPRWFWSKKYTFIPIIYMDQDGEAHSLFYLKGSGWSSGRFHYNYEVFKDREGCVKYVEQKYFKPTITKL